MLGTWEISFQVSMWLSFAKQWQQQCTCSYTTNWGWTGGNECASKGYDEHVCYGNCVCTIYRHIHMTCSLIISCAMFHCCDGISPNYLFILRESLAETKFHSHSFNLYLTFTALFKCSFYEHLNYVLHRQEQDDDDNNNNNGIKQLSIRMWNAMKIQTYFLFNKPHSYKTTRAH